MKNLFVLFAFCAALALADYQRDGGYGDSGVTPLKADLVVTIKDDRDSVPGGFPFCYTFEVTNIRAMSGSSKGTELTIDFDDALQVLEIDYRCWHFSVTPDQGTYDMHSNDVVEPGENIYNCFLGRVHPLGSQIIHAKVRAPRNNTVLKTTAVVSCDDEGEWVQDNNAACEYTVVFALLTINQQNELQNTANRPADEADSADITGTTTNTHLCRWAANGDISSSSTVQQNVTYPTDVDYSNQGYGHGGYDSYDKRGDAASYTNSKAGTGAPVVTYLPTTGLKNVTAWVRCFYNNLPGDVRYATFSESCNCFDPSYQFDNGIFCQCTASCPGDSIYTSGGCGVVLTSAELSELPVSGKRSISENDAIKKSIALGTL